MAALLRPKTATYTVSDTFKVDTQDHEDHTFSGVMFTVECKMELPVELVEIDSISVRGGLGPLTVWVTADTWQGKHENETLWTKVYDRTHPESMDAFVDLKFATPVTIRAGQSIGMYVHSQEPGDDAIVYDNQRSRFTHKDRFICVGPGLAHLSNVPFSGFHPWGAWRQRRQFVGHISYGAKYKLWNPEVHNDFPPAFQELVKTFLFIKPQHKCAISRCSNDILFYILNMCRHDWFPLPEHLRELHAVDERAAAEEEEDPTRGHILSAEEEFTDDSDFVSSEQDDSGGSFDEDEGEWWEEEEDASDRPSAEHRGPSDGPEQDIPPPPPPPPCEEMESTSVTPQPKKRSKTNLTQAEQNRRWNHDDE